MKIEKILSLLNEWLEKHKKDWERGCDDTDSLFDALSKVALPRNFIRNVLIYCVSNDDLNIIISEVLHEKQTATGFVISN